MCFIVNMEIRNFDSKIQFQAKFLKSESLTNIVNYAVEHGKFEELNQARKNIGKYYIRTRLMVDIYDKNEIPVVVVSRYQPKARSYGLSFDEYKLVSQVKFVASKILEPINFGLEILTKMGDNTPNNSLFQKAVVEKGKIQEFLFP